jgi:FkbM family methyltransferase
VPTAAHAVVVSLRSGLQISVDLSDYNGRMLGLFGNVEPTITRICRSLLKPGWCFLDIGANYGGVGLNCVDVVGPGGQVHFFEPQQDLCARIQQCIDASGLNWLFVHAVGLLDREGTLVLRKPVGHSGCAGFFHQYGGETAESVAPLRSFNEYVRPLISGRRFAAKIDVEGSESYILPQVLQAREFEFATFECNPGNDTAAVWSSVQQNGCRLYGVPTSLVQIRVEPVLHRGGMQRYSDFLVVKASKPILTRIDQVLSLQQLSNLL